MFAANNQLQGNPYLPSNSIYILIQFYSAALRSGNQRITIRKSNISIKRYTGWLTTSPSKMAAESSRIIDTNPIKDH